MTVAQVIQNFEKLLAERKVALFCGAGISIASGIPEVMGIINVILNTLGCSTEEQLLFYARKSRNRQAELPVAFEAIIDTIEKKIEFTNSERSFIEIFASNFQAAPCHNHQLWAKLIKAGKAQFIATTNFDTCFEQSLEYSPTHSHVINPYAVPSASIKELSLQKAVIKLHGCMTDPSSIATTVERISKRTTVNNVDAFLERIFTKDIHDTVIVLGYSCSDGMDIIPKIQSIGLSHRKDKVKIVYWYYEKNVPFTWELLKDVRSHSSISKVKEAFRYFPDTILVRGDLDEFTQAYTNSAVSKGIVPVFTMSEEVANPNLTLASIFQTAGYYSNAIALIKQEMRGNTRKIGPLKTAYLLKDIGVAYNYNGDYENALKSHKRALRIVSKIDKVDNIFLAELNNLIGEDYRDIGDYSSAIEYYKMAVELYSSDYENNKSKIALAYSNMSDSFRALGDYEQSQEFCQRSIDMRLDLFGEVNNELSNSYNNMGSTRSAMGDYKSAIFYHRKALNIRKFIYGSGHDWVGQSHINLGATYYYQNQLYSAIKHYKKALKLYKFRVRNDHPMLAILCNNLGNAYLRKEQFHDAISYLTKAKEIWTSNYGEHYNHLVGVRESIKKAEQALKSKS